MYDVVDVAKYIIWFCKEHGYFISNLKLQKLLYFVQAQFLSTLGKPAFEEEIEAWNIGPVVPSAYMEFRIFGNSEIPGSEAAGADKKICLTDQDLMNTILKQCAPYSASYLLRKTHAQMPWKKAYESGNKNVITLISIKKYFEIYTAAIP